VQNLAIFNTTLAQLVARLAALPDGRATLPLITELERTYPLLAALLDLPSPDPLVEQMGPKLYFDNTLLALTVFIQAQALCQPLVLCLEDAHWLDADSLTLLGQLWRTLPGFPVALIFTSRPADDGSLWSLPVPTAVPQTLLNLASLSPAGIYDLCRQLLHWPVADELVAFLWQKSGGNPFFAEQFTLDLLERGLLTWDAAEDRYTLASTSGTSLPPNLTVLLVARLDRLATPVKQVVQTAAILGQRFDVPVLAAMCSPKANLGHAR
jgi:predicted ATPase